MEAKDIMTDYVLSATVGTSFKDIVRVFVEMNIHHMPIITGEGNLRAMVSSNDALRALHEMNEVRLRYDGVNIESSVDVREEMSSDISFVDVNCDIKDIVAIMVRQNIHALPVTENDKMVGIVTSNDILKAIYAGTIKI